MSDLMVKSVQQWYNSTYIGRTGYAWIEEDGIVGPGTCKALVRALQIELGVNGPNGTFGPGTIAAFDAVGINASTTNRNLIRILQGGFYCKGIECGGFDGGYGYNLSQAVIHFRSLTGVGGTGAIDAKHMKALLNTDPFVYDYPGKMYIHTAQQFLNGNYSDYFWKSIGLIPCNGFADRNMSKALTYALQYEEGERGAGLDGIVGTNTLNRAPTLAEGNNSIFVKLLQIGLMCMTGDDVGLDGVFDAGLKSSLTAYQRFMCLHQDPGVTVGEVGRKTWAALLLSKGDVSRACDACDCSQQLSLIKAQRLKESGYNYVGRYLTGTVGGTRNKFLTINEIQHITEAGLSIFAIYQDGGASASYFNYARGYSDAEKAVNAATGLGIPKQEIIYFAVDYDFMAEETVDVVVPHFEGINNYFQENNCGYRIGIYGSRNICAIVSERGLAGSSFVADMSTGYSGNMGYPLPTNWAFDQFQEISFTSPDGAFDLDRNVASGRYTGFNASSFIGGNYILPVDLDAIAEEVNNATDIRDFITLVEQLEDAYDRYNGGYYNHDAVGTIASGAILGFLRHLKYNNLQFNTVVPYDMNFVTFMIEREHDLYETFLEYIDNIVDGTIETRGKLVTDKKYGVFEVPHLAIGVHAYMGSYLSKNSWSSWAGDLASAIEEAGVYHDNTGTSYIKSAEMFFGAHENAVTDILDRRQYNYCDLIANGDCLIIAEIIQSNPTYGVHLLSYALEKYYVTDRLFENRTANYLHAFAYHQDDIISTADFELGNGELAAKVVQYFNDVEQLVLRSKAGRYSENTDCIDATCKIFINAIMYLDIINNIL